MFNDRIDYANPQELPYSRASLQEVLYSWAFALVFIALVLALVMILG